MRQQLTIWLELLLINWLLSDLQSHKITYDSVNCSVVSNSLEPHELQAKTPLSIEFSRQEYWNGLPFPSSGDLSDPGIEPGSPTLQADSLLFEPPRKPKINHAQQHVTVRQRWSTWSRHSTGWKAQVSYRSKYPRPTSHQALSWALALTLYLQPWKWRGRASLYKS